MFLASWKFGPALARCAEDIQCSYVKTKKHTFEMVVGKPIAFIDTSIIKQTL